MVSPVLDEDNIIQLLRMPASTESVLALQSGAVQCLLDMYDRKVTRDEFIAHATKCVTLYANASRMQLLQSVRDVFDAENLTEQSFVKASKELSDIVRVGAEGVIDVVERLKLCPGSKDPVH